MSVEANEQIVVLITAEYHAARSLHLHVRIGREK